MITRRNMMSGLALAAIPVASVPTVEIMPKPLEERLAAMDPMRRAEYHACALAKSMKELNPGAWDVKFDTHKDGPRCVLIMQRV